ncbi:MAG: hypothetical protein R2695_09750 [Acidimicrobiales bacterium]
MSDSVARAARMGGWPKPTPRPPLDDETTAALTLFNEYLEADRARTQREKRVKKAERAKDEAAAVVKKLADKGSAEEKAEAEQAYRAAADRWKKLRDGEEPDDEPAPAGDEAEAAEDAPAAEGLADEADETTATEGPADEADEAEAIADSEEASEPVATVDSDDEEEDAAEAEADAAGEEE